MEADGRLLCISQAQKRMNGQVGFEEGLGAHNFIREIVLALFLTRSSGACFLGLRCNWKTPITNGAATQPHPTQPHRDGEQPSPVVS
jgi:hypothetical protein